LVYNSYTMSTRGLPDMYSLSSQACSPPASGVHTYQANRSYPWSELGKLVIQWKFSITDTSIPDIFGYFLLQYRGFPLSEVKNALMTSVGTKIFVLIMEVFSIESLIRRVC